jgi:D-alanyl-D-alanine dipeptidase
VPFIRYTTLDMGPSPFYNRHASIYWHFFMKKIGMGISAEQQVNRDLLKYVMVKAGFYSLPHEWWHFNGMKKKDARSIYSIIE